jgi:hypothetical protein
MNRDKKTPDFLSAEEAMERARKEGEALIDATKASADDFMAGDDAAKRTDRGASAGARRRQRGETRLSGRVKALYALLLLVAIGGVVEATVAFRAAIPFGTASSWSNAVQGDPNATQGPWFSSTNVQHLLVHDPSDSGDHDTYPVVNVADYPGATDAARLTAAIAAAPINATLRVSKSLNLTTNVTINKPLSLVVEANTTITTNSTSINVTTGPVSLIGRGPTSQIIQGAANTDVVVVTGGPLNVEDLSFTGVAGTSLVNHNSAILATSVNDIKMLRSTFTNFQFHSVLFQGCNRVLVDQNTFVGNIAALFRGGSQLQYSHNLARDPQTPNTTFIIPLQFDSTSGGYGVASDINVSDNIFLNWPASQCIELHTGNQFVVSGNLLDNCYIGVSVNPFQAGDLANDGTISGNTIIVSTTSGISTSIPDTGISLSGLNGSYPVQRVSVVGNTILNSNQYSTSNLFGCINVSGTTNDLLFDGNTLDTCTGNGFALVGTNSRITIENNHMHNFQADSGGGVVGVGVWSITGQSGYITGNDIDGVRLGVRLDVASNMVIGPNNMTNIVVARVLNPGNGTPVSFQDGYDIDAIGTTQTVAQSYLNRTAAAAGAQQYSPMIEMGGQGWNSAGTASEPYKIGMQVVPIQAAGDPTGRLVFYTSTNGAAYSEIARITSSGAVQCLAGSIGFDTTGAGALNLGTNQATSISMGNSSVTTWGLAAATINLGTGTNTTTNISKSGAAVNVHGLLQIGVPAKANNTIASATTIAPTAYVTHITGTTTIQTMTAPTDFAQTNGGGCLILIFDGVAPWNNAGNIFVAGTPTTAGTSVEFCYDNASAKWYPSRIALLDRARDVLMASNDNAYMRRRVA